MASQAVSVPQNFSRTKATRSSSVETAIWTPLTEDTTLPPSKPVETWSKLAERNDQRASLPRSFASRTKSPQAQLSQLQPREEPSSQSREQTDGLRALSPRAIQSATRAKSPGAIQSVLAAPERPTTPRDIKTAQPTASSIARATSPRSPVAVPSPRLQQWRTKQPIEAQDQPIINFSRSARLSEGISSPRNTFSPTRQATEPLVPTQVQRGFPESVALPIRRVASPPFRAEPLKAALKAASLPRADQNDTKTSLAQYSLVEAAAKASANDRVTSSLEAPQPQERGRLPQRKADVQPITQASPPSAAFKGQPVSVTIESAPLSNTEAKPASKDRRRSRPLTAGSPRAADARPTHNNRVTSPANAAARTAMTPPSSPPKPQAPSISSVTLYPEEAHRWEASHGWAFVNPTSTGKPAVNFSRPLRSAISVPHLASNSNDDATPESSVSEGISPLALRPLPPSIEGSATNTGASTTTVSTPGSSAHASTKALLSKQQKLHKLQALRPQIQVRTSMTPEDDITNVTPPVKSASPTLVRRGTHPAPSLKGRPDSEGSGDSYGTMTALPEFTGKRKWQASTFDTSALSEKELAKLKKKGINPALYLEMRAARKGKGLSPLVGNTYIG